MNYQRIYDQIIEKYQTLDLKKGGKVYLESHHIIPKSMGGTNKKENLVNLPAREHYICHWLLVKIFKETNDGHKMIRALSIMSTTRLDKRYTSHTFKYAREAWSKINRGKTHPSYGKKYSKERRAAISRAQLGRKHTEESKKKMSIIRRGTTHTIETREKMVNNFKGRKHTPEAKRKMSEANLGRKHTEETKKKISKGNKGKVRTSEARKNLSISHMGNPAKNKGITYPKVECIHCNKIGGSNLMKRYHFDNCKYK